MNEVETEVDEFDLKKLAQEVMSKPACPRASILDIALNQSTKNAKSIQKLGFDSRLEMVEALLNK